MEVSVDLLCDCSVTTQEIFRFISPAMKLLIDINSIAHP